MINRPTSGLDPEGFQIRPSTPDLPGVFLCELAAKGHLAEYPAAYRSRFLIVRRSVRARRWNLDLWVVVPKRWKIGPTLEEALSGDTKRVNGGAP